MLCLGAMLYAISGMVLTGSLVGSPTGEHWEKNFYVWLGVAVVSLCGAAVGMVGLSRKKRAK